MHLAKFIAYSLDSLGEGASCLVLAPPPWALGGGGKEAWNGGFTSTDHSHFGGHPIV